MPKSEPKVEEVETFGSAVKSYRLVRREHELFSAQPTQETERTENAELLGQEMWRQFREREGQNSR